MNILNSYPFLYGPLQFTFAAFGGGLIWLCLSMTSNKWVRTSHNLINYLLIPVVAFGIVNVLANNLVLSLGMIGALSIMRFRNPVKNSLELTMYLVLFSFGIACEANLQYSIYLLIFTILILIFVYLIKIMSLKFSFLNNFFLLYSNYLEGEEDYVIELVLEEPINEKIFYKNIIYKSYDAVENINLVRFKFDNHIDAENAYEKLFKLNKLKSIELQKP